MRAYSYIPISAHSIDDISTMELHPTDFIVSIVGLDHVEWNMRPANVQAHDNIIKVQFEDAKSMTLQQAKDIIRAVDGALLQRPIKRVLVHCVAGISRSPAVAIALSNIFGFLPESRDLIMQYPWYNTYVLYTMLDAHQREFYERVSASMPT